jgi:hypothetical protein
MTWILFTFHCAIRSLKKVIWTLRPCLSCHREGNTWFTAAGALHECWLHLTMSNSKEKLLVDWTIDKGRHMHRAVIKCEQCLNLVCFLRVVRDEHFYCRKHSLGVMESRFLYLFLQLRSVFDLQNLRSNLLYWTVQAVNICHAIEDRRKFLLGITWKKLETAKIISGGDSLRRLDCIKCFLPVRGPPESVWETWNAIWVDYT